MKKEGRRVDVEHDTDVGFKDNGVVTSDGGEVTFYCCCRCYSRARVIKKKKKRLL